MENLETRNPVMTPKGHIDCELNHPLYGWIPFTATEYDPHAYGRNIYARLILELEGSK